jgi:hypothetical protein
MRCSLLLLSTYLDGELNQRRAAELDAHLIGCSRCQEGLGYLREESQRISSLARVRVPDHSAHALLAHVGLITIEDDLPGKAPPPPPAHDDPDARPWFGGTPGKALPWSPPRRQASPTPPPPELHRPAHVVAPVATLDKPPAPHMQATAAHNVEHHTPDSAQLEVPGIAVPSSPGPAAVPAVDADEHEEPVEQWSGPVRAPQRVSGSKVSDSLRRMRDSLAVRWALMRGGAADYDDSVDTFETSPEDEPSSQTHERLEPRSTAALAEALHAVESRAVRDADDWSIPSDLDILDHPVAPAASVVAHRQRATGRHLRGVARSRGASLLQRASGGMEATGVRDRRLWAFMGMTAALLVLGLLIGKQVASTSVARLPAASVRATPAVPHASTAPVVPQATPAPSLTPTPLQLTGAQTLGSGAGGYAVADLRYGVHPGDFRIVFDFSASGGSTPSGSPVVTAGFGNATTLYIIFVGVAPGSPAVSPRGGVVTGVSLLPHSPIAGRIVYEVTLSRAAKLSAIYLSNPTRLVLDLR